ncbi:MAG TPA: ATP-binding protein, partial [Candidatus Aenigmarchaeota archaeon]|nr:ATP-binding protein [Candidatus Aenigmarchaeota archaeon]
LGEIIDNYIFARREWGIKSSIIILDEITFVDEWYRAMKSRIDRKVFRNDVLIVTGSASIEILKGKERFPGRRGYGRDIYFLPIDFNNFSRIFGKMELKDYSLDFKKLEGVIKANRVFKERLFRLFKMYLECGGFPLSIIDMFTKNKITFRTIRTYLDWLKNDWRRAGKNEKYMKEVISYILKARASPISWFNIAKETSINSPHTVQSYVETLENLFCVKVLNMISPDFKILYRKNKKIHIADPFIYRVLSYYTRCEVLEENIVESVTASHFSRIGEVFFWRNKSEVDMIFLKNKTQIGVEVKWGLKKWRKPKHLKKTILLDKNNLPVFLSSVRWIDKNF